MDSPTSFLETCRLTPLLVIPLAARSRVSERRELGGGSSHLSSASPSKSITSWP